MAWTAPMTAVANATFTAAQFNTNVRDNLNETAPAKATTSGSLFVGTGVNAIVERVPAANEVAATETTAATAYGALTTLGPAVTVTCGTTALVMWSCRASNNTANAESFMAIEVSGATSLTAADTFATGFTSSTVNAQIRAGVPRLLTLNAGSNTFTAKYRVTAGTGTFSARYLTVIPL